MIELYNLRMYFRDGNQMLLVDEETSRNKDHLVAIAANRKRLCDKYLPILLVFRTAEGIIV